MTQIIQNPTFNSKFFIYLSGFLLRLLVILIIEVLESFLQIKITDVDYFVLSDGARHVFEGESPYERFGYRYTPLLSWLLLPNVFLFSSFGKILFSLCDLGVTFILESLDSSSPSYLLWLFNPFIVGISSRGSWDSLLCLLILLSLILTKRGLYHLSGIALGVSIHFKMIPILYLIPLLLSISPNQSLASLYTLNSFPRRRLLFSCLGTLLSLTALCTLLYGSDFLQESFTYHVSRFDTRHNFSVYFYMFYLNSSSLSSISILSLFPFLLQSLLVGVIIFKFGISSSSSSSSHLHFMLFAITFVFVSFNKILTSQYFLWYWTFIPLILPQLGFNQMSQLSMFLLWSLSQGSWLLTAYHLEFEGKNTFYYIWIQSLLFFSVNVGLLSKCIKKYKLEKLGKIKSK